VPELPEVEVLVRALRPRVLNRRIDAVRILRPQLVAAPGPRAFVRRLRGRMVVDLRRRGKTLCARLDDGGHWLTHLRMTGSWEYHRTPLPPADRHVLAVFSLDAGELHFRDPRRFGRMWWLADAASHFAGMGPEPLSRAFHGCALSGRLASRRAPVKQVLLDPAVVAGIGNIYASEACFLARVDPRRPAHRLPQAEAERLARAIKTVLRRAIRLGSTVAPRVAGYRAEARFPDEFAVYGREGQPCLRCRAPIRRVVLGGRSTFFCPSCQAGRPRRD